MNLWDHLCTLLRARVVSTEDVSSKVRVVLQTLPAGEWPMHFGRRL